jgi:peroxiredoxin
MDRPAEVPSEPKRPGLPAGTPAPAFRLPDLDGTSHELEEFRGKRVLLVFSEPECAPCQPLAKELARRERRNRLGDLQVVMISRGDPETNRERAREHGIRFPVLLQERYEVAKEYAMFATPVAYLIDEQGTIAKDVAIGPDAILQLA